MCRMQRNRGQFTSSKPKGDEATSELTASDGSPNWGSVEGRPPSAAEYVEKNPIFFGSWFMTFPAIFLDV